MRATFGVPPGIDSVDRLGSPWPNCFLAGDWIETGWPSTMESAARSGHLAAEALCASTIEPRKFLEPDLKPQGLMKLSSKLDIELQWIDSVRDSIRVMTDKLNSATS